MVFEDPKKQIDSRNGRLKKIQVEVVKVPKQRRRSRKIVEAEISQFKECSLSRNGKRHKKLKIT